MSILDTAHRLVIVTRKFWPMTDDASHRLFQLIDALRGCGVDIHVLTARWHPSWPEHATLRGAKVTRILPPPRTNWNEGHFQKNVVAWLSQHAETYDSIYVDRADGLASAITARGGKWHKTIIGRFSNDNDTHGIPKGQFFGAQAAADACRRCDRIIAPTASAHRILVSQGIEPHRIERIPDWVEHRAEKSQEARAAAATALFQVSSDFVIPSRTDLIVHYGTAETKELLTVTQALCDLLDQGASVRLWILGSGASQVEIHDAVKDRGWHREILQFDGFDNLDEIASVADLAIVANPSVAFQYSAQLFLQSDIPVVVADGPDTKSWLGDGQSVKSYSDAKELLSLLQQWQIHRQQWAEEAKVLRAHAQSTRFSAEKCRTSWESMLRSSSIGTTR